jgi:integrase
MYLSSCSQTGSAPLPFRLQNRQLDAAQRHHVHVVFNACLGATTRKGILTSNPMARVEQIPAPGETNHGLALDADELRKVVEGFRGTALFEIVAVAGLTGARRNEILALRWTDFDTSERSLRIERALEETKEAGLTFVPPKTKRGLRTFVIDDECSHCSRRNEKSTCGWPRECLTALMSTCR